MYKIVETHNTAKLWHNVEISPVVTMEDEHGGRAHIWVDDNCYQIGLERAKAGEVFVRPVTHIFPEAFNALKTLPDLD